MSIADAMYWERKYNASEKKCPEEYALWGQWDDIKFLRKELEESRKKSRILITRIKELRGEVR